MGAKDALSFSSGLPSAGQVSTFVSTILKRLLVILVFIIWVFLWGLVARLHFRMGDLGSAAVVGLLFVVPAVIGVVHYVGEWSSFD